MIRASNWRPMLRNTLQGFLTLTLSPSGVVMNECSLHEKGDKRWIGLPVSRSSIRRAATGLIKPPAKSSTRRSTRSSARLSASASRKQLSTPSTGCSAGERAMSAAEIVLFSKKDGALTKQITLDAHGQPLSDGNACRMRSGSAQRVRVTFLEQVARLIIGLDQRQAIALGGLREDLPDECQVTTDRALKNVNGTPRPNLIARTRKYIYFTSRPGFVLIDFDQKGMSPRSSSASPTSAGLRPP